MMEEEEENDVKLHMCEQCADLKNELLKQMNAFKSMAYWNPNIDYNILVQTLKQVVLKFGSCLMPATCPSFQPTIDSNCFDDSPSENEEEEQEQKQELTVDENYMMDEENIENEPVSPMPDVKPTASSLSSAPARKRKRPFGTKRRNIRRKKQKKVGAVVNQNSNSNPKATPIPISTAAVNKSNPTSTTTNGMKVVVVPKAKVVTLVQRRANASRVKAAQFMQSHESAKRRRSKLQEELSETLGTSDISQMEKPKEAKASLEEIHSQIYQIDKFRFQCVHCHGIYSSRPVCTTHIRRTHLREDIVVCNKCKKPYFDIYVLKKHQLVCQGTSADP